MLRNLKNFVLNFGPQHPAAHGVLRLIVEIEGEFIKKVDPHIGLLHRATEKLIEYKTYMQAVPYFDRLDYVSAMAQEHTYSLCVETLTNLKLNLRTRFIRILFLEITRILNHLMALTTHALDVGALTPFLWGFEVRELLMEFYERACGARLHSAFIRPGGISKDISDNLLLDIQKFCYDTVYRIDEIEDLLSNNRIWCNRLKGIGVIPIDKVFDWALSGPLVRSVGLPWDLRLLNNYEGYNYFNWVIPVGVLGDSFDRYLIRLFEMRQSLNIMSICTRLLLSGSLDNSHRNLNTKIINPKRMVFKKSMEGLIHHFKLMSTGFKVNKNDFYMVTETPKGEFGVCIYSNNSTKPDRCRIRAPGFLHLQSLSWMSEGLLLSDLVTLIGTQDLVFGEVDR